MEKINYTGLEEHLQNLVSAQGSDSNVSLTKISGANSISARINHLDGNISFEVPTIWNPLQYKNIKHFTERLNLRNPRKKVLEDVAFHEIGHHKLKNDSTGLGCPEDLKGKEITVDAVSKAMIEANKFSQQGALYLENVISDIIDNLNCSNYAHLNGLSMFFAEQGELNNQKFSPLYEAFVKLNMYLWGRKKQKQLLSNYYTNDENVDKVVAECIQDVKLTENKQTNLKLLFNKQEWHQTFYKFAKSLVKLMDESSPEFLPGSGSEGYKVPAEFEEGKFNPEEIDDEIMKRVLDNDNMKKVMMRRNEEGDSLPNFVENWRALDYFYQAHASELYIKAESPKKGHSMPIAPVQARKFDSDKDRLENILFGKVLLDENGKPCLAIPRNYIEITQNLKKSIKSYPELNIAVLDTSISMTEGANSNGEGNTNIVPWGDNTKYHYSVLAYYGVEKALHRMGVAIKTKYNLITFASSTDSTGEKGYEDRNQIKKRILQPEFGSTTNIDINVLKKSTRQPGSVLMTISDGEIWNWNGVKDDFKKTISDKFYVHFQIGGDSQATRDIESWGSTVVRITDASEMPRKAIDITQNFYRSFASGGINVK